MTEIWGSPGLGRRMVIVVLALVVGLAIVGPAAAGVAQKSPADDQYGGEQPTATNKPAPQTESGVFVPPTVVSAGQEESGGILPFTGAALIVPSVLGGLLLAGGLFLVYRTRRRETEHDSTSG